LTVSGQEESAKKKLKTLYDTELDNNPALGQLETIIDHHDRITLLYAAHDPKVNHTQVLLTYLREHAT